MRLIRTHKSQKLLLICLFGFLLASCIRPETTPTVTPAGNIPVNVTQPPIFNPTTVPTEITPTNPNDGDSSSSSTNLSELDLNAIQTYIQTQAGRTVITGTLAAHRVIDVPQGIPTEVFIGFTYTNPSGLPCVGVVMANRGVVGELIVFIGDAQCATEPGAIAVAGSWLLLSANTGSVWTATVGHIFNPSIPVNAAALTYTDGSQSQTNFDNNHLLSIRSDFITANRVTFINQNRNIEADVFILP